MNTRILSEKRAYLQLNTGKFVKFFHVQQGLNYLHIYFSGLETKKSRILQQWEEIGISKEDLDNDRYNWKNLQPYPITEKLNYISFHPEGKCFRFQFENKIQGELKMEDCIDDFIDIIFMSDSSERYNFQIDKPKINSLILPQQQPNIIWLIKGLFSKSGHITIHPILGEYFKKSGLNKNITLCFYDPQSILVDQITFNSRPKGTVIIFLFHLKNGTYTRKGLILG